VDRRQGEVASPVASQNKCLGATRSGCEVDIPVAIKVGGNELSASQRRSGCRNLGRSGETAAAVALVDTNARGGVGADVKFSIVIEVRCDHVEEGAALHE